MAAVPDLDLFVQLLVALEPWLDKVVVVGGWAHRLYRLHPDAQRLNYPPLITLDADVAVPPRLPVRDRDQDIRQRLLANGFSEEFLGSDRPPATHYRLGSGSSGFYAEFLTPLIGGPYDRRSRRKATLQVAGVTSQQLRFVELLLHRPWTVELKEHLFSGRIQVANPASFLAQKLLIHSRRRSDDRAKDILYIHDTLQLFGSRLAELRKEWQSSVTIRLSAHQTRSLSKMPHKFFGEVTDDIRRAALIASGRVHSPQAIRDACLIGLDELLS